MKKLFLLLIFIFSTNIFGQNHQELQENLDINLSRFPIEKVFIENTENNSKINLQKGNYKINRKIGNSLQDDTFSIDKNGLITGKTVYKKDYQKKITYIKDSEISQTEVYIDELLANRQIFEPFRDSILTSEIFDGNNKIRSKVTRYFTKKDSLKAVIINYDENGKIIAFIDEIKKTRIDYDNNGKISKHKEIIDGQVVEKNYKDGKITLLTKGSFPYFYLEQYDSNGNIELKEELDENRNQISTSYKNGKLIAKSFSENNKSIDEYYENGKLIEKQIRFIKDFKYYVETYKNGKLIEMSVSEMEEKKAY
ncbi:uncharacterized protein YuzE [Flavobacterium arsenatis]|uniref:Uncharacterized protein YuzE n=1 Tax=Flavobacterium arsenatis TaxID=1484332 RepID=A0ABU1TUM5_9FLAO|nr:hypothetical protein [Flavobacterium arsenatis]MDR6969546.1 uncharacterized protein YuzE [Flavobacterium arsenatis]